MFTDIYLQTTSRHPPLASIRFWGLIVVSIIFHAITYTAFANMVAFIFMGRALGYTINRRMMVCLLVFMFFGYIARMLHVHEVYRTIPSAERARAFIDAHYNSWIFIG